jgi:predicted transcriptional regulator
MSAINLTAKDVVQRVVDSQPDDCTLEEIIRELAFHRMIERGLADIDAGRTITHE